MMQNIAIDAVKMGKSCFNILILFLINNLGTTPCSLNASLNEDCDRDSNCKQIWSYCNETSLKCSCVDGFTQTDTSTCHPLNKYCPPLETASDSLIKVSGGANCEIRIENDKLKHNCSEGYFCFYYLGFLTMEGKFYGHCCPETEEGRRKRHSCPLTKPLTEGLCPNTSRFPPEWPLDRIPDKRTCPSKTHSCQSYAPNVTEDVVCCPTPCRGSSKRLAIAGTNECVDKVKLGDTCLYDVQCPARSKCKSKPDTGLEQNVFVCQI